MKLELLPGDFLGAAAAVDAASQTGLLFALLTGPPKSVEALARDARLDVRGVSAVLDVLVALGLAQRLGDDLALSDEIAALDQQMPGSVALGAALFGGTQRLVRTGEVAFSMDGDAGERERAYRGAVGGLGNLFERAAAAFADVLGGHPNAILDVGCGSGVWGLAVLRKTPSARLTGLDLPEVLAAFRARAAAEGLEQRCDAIAGDMHSVQIPAGQFDRVLLANVLRLEPDDRAAALIQRLATAVRPGGDVVILDALASGTPDREVARAVYGLHLALRTRNARVHAPERVAQMLTDAGLVSVRRVDFGLFPGAMAALVAERPATECT